MLLLLLVNGCDHPNVAPDIYFQWQCYEGDLFCMMEAFSLLEPSWTSSSFG